jgi:hypothetical protein
MVPLLKHMKLDSGLRRYDDEAEPECIDARSSEEAPSLGLSPVC